MKNQTNSKYCEVYKKKNIWIITNLKTLGLYLWIIHLKSIKAFHLVTWIYDCFRYCIEYMLLHFLHSYRFIWIIYKGGCPPIYSICLLYFFLRLQRPEKNVFRLLGRVENGFEPMWEEKVRAKNLPKSLFGIVILVLWGCQYWIHFIHELFNLNNYMMACLTLSPCSCLQLLQLCEIHAKLNSSKYSLLFFNYWLSRWFLEQIADKFKRHADNLLYQTGRNQAIIRHFLFIKECDSLFVSDFIQFIFDFVGEVWILIWDVVGVFFDLSQEIIQ